MNDEIILAIESSCDETACAILKNGEELLSNIVSSQINVHTEFGGVVPEVASRLHVENISYVISSALKEANVRMEDVDAITYTQGPGLIGSLHVGVLAAKTLGYVYHKPLVPVHHLAGHIYANEYIAPLRFPLLALVVSGGHTELVVMEDDFRFEIVGTTHDDAIGEAYDKVARVLGLGYPGGPKIDKLAKEGKPVYPLPKVHTENPLDFSFSGLKSAVIQSLGRIERKGEVLNTADMACSFQEAALLEIRDRIREAIEIYQPKHFVAAGGVAANSRLRELIREECEKHAEMTYTIPPMWCCTDNAAMIAKAGWHAYKLGVRGDLFDGPDPGLELESYDVGKENA
ncbi:MAG: tRNA (adenosine(37)-N6)-threonylcarbamoyltransferase complex transferase subunit TsaD [Erysipelotrichales bacterium]|nr:tRNA (adenosine(37)-N6)-threonylcarbamoyltransferase complex transferase subunit TsaD [Erysipelotrichales bacterium]